MGLFEIITTMVQTTNHIDDSGGGSIITSSWLTTESLTPLVVAVVVVCAVQRAFFSSFRSGAATTNPPPAAPAGMLETVREISGPKAPFFLLKMHRAVNSNIFRIPIPLPGRRFYVVASHDLQREIMNDGRADKPAEVYGKFKKPGFPDGLFTRRTKDPLWKTARKCAAPAFSKNEVGRMNSVCSKHLQRWITERLEGEFISRDAAFDPSREMTFLTFCTIMEAGFEYVPTADEYETYHKNTITYQKEFGLRKFAKPFRRSLGWFFEGYRNAMKSVTENYAFIQKVVRHYRDSPNKSPNNTLIKLLTENERIGHDAKQLAAEIRTFVIAGFDTTGYTLSTTLTLIAKHPEIARRIRVAQAELEDPQRQVSAYLSCVLKESRRYLPVAAMGTCRQFDAPKKFGGYDIPPGSILLMPQMLAHRDVEIFGPDPDAFRPERWLAEEGPPPASLAEESKSKSMAASLLTFATGNRNCVGQALAVAELESVLPRLLTKYEFSIEKEGELDYFLTLKYVGALLKAKKIEE